MILILAGGSHAQAQQRTSADAKTGDVAPIKFVDIDVLPYYQSADVPGGRPKVAVNSEFDAQLSSNKREEILAVRDAIQARPQLITPMTLMVLAIRLYDVGLRDDAVFWFYVAKDRYFTVSGVLDVESPLLAQVKVSVANFARLAGPYMNSYAFCDIAKQQETLSRAFSWVEQHPYEVLFMKELPAMPGNRKRNLRKALKSTKAYDEKEKKSLVDPENLKFFEKRRKAGRVNEQFCWRE